MLRGPTFCSSASEHGYDFVIWSSQYNIKIIKPAWYMYPIIATFITIKKLLKHYDTYILGHLAMNEVFCMKHMYVPSNKQKVLILYSE